MGLEGLAGYPAMAATTGCLPFDAQVKARVTDMFARMEALLAGPDASSAHSRRRAQ